MSKFEVGQEVIFTRGDLKDVLGVVVIPHFQLSQSDWPEVLVEYEGDRRFFVDICEVRPAEDPYEYSMADRGLNGEWKVVGDIMDQYNRKPMWGTKDWAEKMTEFYTEDFAHSEFKVVKRRKAGKVEDV